MIDFGKLKGEYTMLSYLVYDAARARDVLPRAMIGAEAFTDDACRAAFNELMANDATDEVSLLGIAKRHIPDIGEPASLGAFGALSANVGALEYEATDFARHAIARDALQEINVAAQWCSGENAAVFVDKVKSISESLQAKFAAVDAAFSAGDADGGDASAAPKVDESLLHMPGFVDDCIKLCRRSAPYPNQTLAFTGALALLAHLAGRKFIGPNDARPNIYLVALANSGVGKDFPRRLNRNIAQLVNMENSIKDGAGSGQGIEDALRVTPTLLMQMDEFDTTLNTLKDERGSKQANEATWNILLSVFSAANTNYSARLKAKGKDGSLGDVIYNPSLSILATAIPQNFYGALCERALKNGFLARCLVFEAGRRGSRNMDSGLKRIGVPRELLDMVRTLADMGRHYNLNAPVDDRDVVTVDFAPGAEKEAAKVDGEADTLRAKAERADDEMEMSVWSRSYELVMKLSLLYAISEGVAAPESDGFAISPDAVRWAWKVVKAAQMRMLAMAREHTAANPMEEKVMNALRYIRKAGKRGLSRQDLGRKHFLAHELDMIEVTLVDRGEIEVASISATNGKQAKRYIAINDGK